MANSSLATLRKISPHKNSPRNHAIDTVSIHCYVGQTTIESAAAWFADPTAKCSCNYVIGHDGKIAVIVDEADRSWCTSNEDNDRRAITIEVASDSKHPYAVKDAAYKALIDLLVDICKRNPGIGTLKWKADKSLIGQPDKQNMTVHRWFNPNKTCPGEYLYNRHAQIAAEVNARLEPVNSGASSSEAEIGVGDTVSISVDATYYNGSSIPYWVLKKDWIVKQVKGDRVVIDKSADGTRAINSPINAKYLKIVKRKSEFPYMVKVETDNLYIRKGPGTNYAKNGFTGKGVFTITDAKSGRGSKTGWGKLKSGEGWISLDYAKRI